MRNILKGAPPFPFSPRPHITSALQDLMAENHVLRGYLRNLSEFIGDGAGGLLSKLGWSMQDFDKFVNKSETDTAYESYQRRKREGQPTSSSATSRKRGSEDDTSSNAKRARGPNERDDAERSTDAFPVLMPMNPVTSGSNLYTGRSPQDTSLFSELMRGPNGSPMLMPGPSSPSSYATSPSQVPPSNGNYQGSYVTPLSMGVDSAAINSMSFVNNTSTPTIPQQSRPSVGALEDLEPIDPKNVEAQKLISFVIPAYPRSLSPSSRPNSRYHLENYKRNSAYCLPASLRPTLVQRFVVLLFHRISVV
jgi:hypothetical protein